MSDLDLLQHIGTIQQHIWVLHQSRPSRELNEASQLLQNLTKKLLTNESCNLG